MTQIGSITLTPTKIQQILEAGRRQLSPEEFEELSDLLFDLEIYGLTPWINVQLGTLMSKIEWELELEPSPEWAEALQACDYAFLGRELKDMCYEVGASPVGHKKQLCARLYKRKVSEVVAVMEPYLKGKTPEQIKEEVERYAQAMGDNVEVYTSSEIPPEVARDAGLHRDPQVEFRYTTVYLGDDLGWFQRDLQRLLRERISIPMLVVDAYYIRHRLPQTEHLYASKLRQVKDRLEDIHRKDPEEFYQRKRLIQQAIKEREKGQTKTMPELTLQELNELLIFTGRLYR